MREANSSKVGLQQKVAGEQSSNCLCMCVCGCRGVKVVTSDLVFHMHVRMHVRVYCRCQQHSLYHNSVRSM